VKQKTSNNLHNAEHPLFDVLRNRRSIPHFTDEPISAATLERILRAGIRAPFAAQLYSIVYTRSMEKIKKLKRLGIYPRTQVLMIFFVDIRKLQSIIQKRGYRYHYDDGTILWLGIQDAVLVAENVILAAEAIGLGSVFLGAAPHFAGLISEVFDVPPRVFPVVALCLGYPNLSVATEVRPRFPVKYSAFAESYKDLSDPVVEECMAAMDTGFLTQGYYMKIVPKMPLVKGEDTIDYDRYSWSEHISRKFSQGLHGTKQPLFATIRQHGFEID
jgi:nitroreductase